MKTLLQLCRILKFLRSNTLYPRFKGEESLILFSKNALKQSYSNATFKNFPGDNVPDHPSHLWERKFCSRSPKMYQNSPTAMQNSKTFPGTIPRIPVLWVGKFVFILRKFTKTLVQQCRIHKLSETIPRTPVLGESLFPFSENVPKLFYINAEFQNHPGVEAPDPVFRNGRGKLPPLEIVSGYASEYFIRFNERLITTREIFEEILKILYSSFTIQKQYRLMEYLQ